MALITSLGAMWEGSEELTGWSKHLAAKAKVKVKK